MLLLVLPVLSVLLVLLLLVISYPLTEEKFLSPSYFLLQFVQWIPNGVGEATENVNNIKVSSAVLFCDVSSL